MTRLGAALAAALAAAAVVCGNASAWTRHDLHPVTQPAFAGGRILVLAVSGGRLELLGLDPRTGRTVWSQPASTGDTAPGQPPLLTLSQGNVLYLRGIAGVTQVAAADPRTGNVRWHSSVGVFTAVPIVCADRRTAVCLTGATAPNLRGTLIRLDARTGKRLAGVVFSRSPYGRAIGTDLFDPGPRRPERLVSTHGAGIAWTRPLQAIFTLPGASTDWGWNFDRLDRFGLYVGSPGWGPVQKTTSRMTFDLARSMIAGFRIADGRVVWRSRGIYSCFFLPCPGSSLSGYDTPSQASGPELGIRLLETGTVSGPANGGGHETLSAHADATLQGFDPASGRTRWSFDAGRNQALITGEQPLPQLDRETVVLRDRNGRLRALDLRTGARRAVSSSAHAWCRRYIQYRLAAAYSSGNGSTHEYIGQDALFPCTATGRRVATPPRVPSFVGAFGVRAGRLVVWSESGGVFAAEAQRRPAR